MRAVAILLASICICVPGAGMAQNAKNSPEAIICAMTGSCDADAATGGTRIPVGNEKAFSLARPSGPAVATATSTAHAAVPATRSRTAAPVRTARRAVAPARVRPGGGLDMLVTFRSGSAEMTTQAQAEARTFAAAMAAPQMAGMRFTIEGHTDAVGQHDRNMVLSQQRAQSVVDYLVAQGVDASRLTAKGYGPDRPLRGTRAMNPSNRRVEFVKTA